MLNMMTVSGYVRFINEGRKSLTVKLSMYRPVSNIPDGEDKAFLLQVKIFDPPQLQQGDEVIVCGSYDSHRYNGKSYSELIANGKNVFVVSKASQMPGSPPPGFPVPPSDSYGQGMGF